MQTPESNLEALANRVAKLEKQNRRLKKVGIAMSVVASAFVAMGQTPPKKPQLAEPNEVAGAGICRWSLEARQPYREK